MSDISPERRKELQEWMSEQAEIEGLRKGRDKLGRASIDQGYSARLRDELMANWELSKSADFDSFIVREKQKTNERLQALSANTKIRPVGNHPAIVAPVGASRRRRGRKHYR